MPGEVSLGGTDDLGMVFSDSQAAAQWYAKRGLPVFPVHSAPNGACSCGVGRCKNSGKHPRTAHGFKDATIDAGQIGEWWRKWPNANIAIPTGGISGFLVLDVDPRNGGDESLAALIAQHGPLPETAVQITGGGGRHIVFRHPSIRVPKTLAEGIDIKADGGYILVAPSVHASGGAYQWDGAGARALLTISEPPAWVLDLMASSQIKSRTANKAGGKWTPGRRNDKLTSLAGSMRRRAMSRDAIEAALLEENRLQCSPPLGKSEVVRIADSVASYPPGSRSDQQNSIPSDSAGFHLTDDAVLYNDPDPEKEALKVCGRLEIVALTRDSAGQGWGRLLKWSDAEGRRHDWAMPMSLLAGDGNEYRARLLDGGLALSPNRKARELLTTYLQTTPVETKALCVSQVGWQSESFVLPDVTIGPEDHDTILFQTPYDSECFLNQAGAVEDWKNNVGRLCSGNSRLLFAVSCAFVGPLLAIAGAESGGVHFVGGSSTGKSTALLVGGSVLGGGRRNGFVQSWRTTANGLEAIADLHNDLTLFLDEVSQIDACEAADVAYLLANGSGKSRMSRNMGIRKKLTWSLMFVSSGEVTLSDHARSGGKRVRAGVDVRLLNIDADAGAKMGMFENIHGSDSPDAFARQLKSAALRFYGTPLRPWLKLLTHERSAIEKALKNFQSDFLNKHVVESASRAAQRFALIAAAGELATDAGLTGWRTGEATDASSKCFESWIGQRGTIGAGDTEAAIKQVRQYLQTHGASRFQITRHVSRAGFDDNPDEAQVVRDRAGFRRRDSNTGEVEYLIFVETFRTEICVGHSHQFVRKILLERGYLVREAPHWTIKPRSLPEMPTGTRVYCIRAAILEDAE